MSKRRKIKLTPEQKKWHENLQAYVKTIAWYQDPAVNLKQEASEGRYAVFSGEGKVAIFDWVACMSDIDTAEAYIKWNSSCLFRLFRLVDLEDLTILKEIDKKKQIFKY